VIDDLDVDHLYDSWVANTQGDLKVGDISSRMVHVMYGDKVGFAYGGFLFPFERVDKNNKNTAANLQGWDVNRLEIEEVFHKGQLIYKIAKIDFRDEIVGSMDPTQRKLLLTKLFPEELTMAQLNEFSKKTETNLLKIGKGLDTEFYKIRSNSDLGILSFEYKRIQKGFLEKIKTPTVGYITASQLNMRKSINPKSEIITKIPIGNMVEILNEQSDFIVIGGAHGRMTKVQYKDQEGYVFDAYLSPTPLLPSAGNIPYYDLDKAYKAIIDRPDFSDWKHNYSQNWMGEYYMIVPSRDKFQALKSLRQFYPLINDLDFKWDDAKQDYNISSSNREISIRKEEDGSVWISKYYDEGGINISINKIKNHLYKVSISYEEPGC